VLSLVIWSNLPKQANLNNNIQRRTIQREFKHVGPTKLRDPLRAGWGLLPTLRWVGPWFFRPVENISQSGMKLATPLFGFGYLSIVIQ
jgi:hypothetical protein